MSAVLLVTKDKKPVVKVAIKGSVFIIGRSEHCELPLDEPLASRQHAELLLEKNTYWIRDRGSRNGTLVNGEKIGDRRKLQDGDEIRIGGTQLKFVRDPGAEEAGLSDQEATRVASFTDPRGRPPAPPAAGKNLAGLLQVKLRVAAGPLSGGVFRNWDSPLTIGRGLENQVVLLDEATSNFHARIVQEGEHYFIEDLNSSNGTFLDGVKVQRAELAHGQQVKIGASTLAFELVDLRKRRRTLRIALLSLLAVVVVAALVKFLQPPDLAGERVAAAQGDVAQGEWAKAQAEYGLALQLDPNRDAARRGLEEVKTEIKDRELLATAEGEAAAEDYDKAKDLCYRVLRDFPQMAQALELDAVIKSIENAKIAYTARNWSDAEQLLERAQETYPKSTLIRTRLEQVRMELTAEQNLSGAQDDLRQGEMDQAEPRLQSIPANSVYFAAAKEQLDQIARNRQVAGDLTQAEALYRDGRLAEARAAVAAGLQQAGTDARLLALQARIQQMDALVKPLAAAEALGPTEDVEALLAADQACADVIALEPDPANALRRRAQAAAGRIAAQRRNASQANVLKAEDALQGDNRKDALRWYDLALKADASDPGVVARREKLSQQIVAECRRLYQEGIVHQDLGQADLAREAFRQVLALGSPGEEYFKKAADKLKAMSE